MSEPKVVLHMPRRCEFPDDIQIMSWYLAESTYPQYEPVVSGEYRRKDAPVCHDITCRVCYTDKQRENSKRRREILDKMARESQELYELD